MWPSRWLNSLLAMVLIVISMNVGSPVAACCGSTPEWFFTAFVEGQPICFNRDQSGGSVSWGADYHMPASSLHVHIFGDGVITNTTGSSLPHQPGASVDTIHRTASWQWSPSYLGTTRTVRVQIDAWGVNDFVDGAMIRIACGPQGLQRWEIENFEGHLETYGG